MAFAVIYTFHIKKEKEEVFLQAWKGLTELIRDFEGSYGSRLHRKSDEVYMAYALWPDRKTWEDAGDSLPQKADQFRAAMREACLNIETSHELEVVEDLLKPLP